MRTVWPEGPTRTDPDAEWSLCPRKCYLPLDRKEPNRCPWCAGEGALPVLVCIDCGRVFEMFEAVDRDENDQARCIDCSALVGVGVDLRAGI